MPPKGWRKNAPRQGKTFLEPPKWNPAFKPFGHRVNFLSPEGQHLSTGTMRILPARNPEKRERSTD